MVEAEGRSTNEDPFRYRLTTERKQEIVLEMTCPPTNPILSQSLVNYPRGNSSGELVGKFDLAVMTIPLAIGRRYGGTFAIKLAGIFYEQSLASPLVAKTFLFKTVDILKCLCHCVAKKKKKDEALVVKQIQGCNSASF